LSVPRSRVCRSVVLLPFSCCFTHARRARSLHARTQQAIHRRPAGSKDLGFGTSIRRFHHPLSSFLLFVIYPGTVVFHSCLSFSPFWPRFCLPPAAFPASPPFSLQPAVACHLALTLAPAGPTGALPSASRFKSLHLSPSPVGKRNTSLWNSSAPLRRRTA